MAFLIKKKTAPAFLCYAICDYGAAYANLQKLPSFHLFLR